VQVGTAAALERSATPGLVGAARDVLRLTAGTRVLGHSGGVFFFDPSPLAAVAMHIAITALTWTPAYCDTPLIRHPLTRARVLQAAAALQAASLPLAAVQPVAAPLLADSAPGGSASLHLNNCSGIRCAWCTAFVALACC
jgi:hypothetical protein